MTSFRISAIPSLLEILFNKDNSNHDLSRWKLLCFRTTLCKHLFLKMASYKLLQHISRYQSSTKLLRKCLQGTQNHLLKGKGFSVSTKLVQ